MYDDFWAGYNYGNRPLKMDPTVTTRSYSISGQQQQAIQQEQQKKMRQQQISSVYDKSKFTRMQGPAGEQGEIYANGKMYIILGPGRQQVRTFPSRPFAIKYMQGKGWVLL